MRKVKLDIIQPQTKKVVIVKVTLINNYERDYYDEVPQDKIFEFSEPQEVTTEEYDSLSFYIRNQTRYCSPRYVMIEKVDVKSPEVINIFEEIKEKAKKAKEAELARSIADKKRKETLAKKAEERKRKQLEKLKMELGESV